MAEARKDDIVALREELAALREDLSVTRKELKRKSTSTSSSPLRPNVNSPNKRRSLSFGRSRKQEVRFVVVTGGVMSGLGKGITASSIGRLLKDCGWGVTAIKIDPYVNCDAGTMSPFEHGECYVLDDGGETDLDLGNYERFVEINLTRQNSITTGNVYKSVIDRERKGEYLGKTVQVVPHVTGEIIRRIKQASETPVDCSGSKPDVCIIELGGTIGDIESMPFIEALRQMKVRGHSMCFVHVSLVPTPGGEQKTKPTQHSVRLLSQYGLHADFIACRCDSPVSRKTKEKIGHFCNVPPEHVLSMHNVSDIWKVPLLLHQQNAVHMITNTLGMYLPHGKPDLEEWTALVNAHENASSSVDICIVGKYTGEVSDTYLSVCRALKHAAVHADRRLRIIWVNAEDLVEKKDSRRQKRDAAWKCIKESHGILVPGGFGIRGIEGKLAACQFARESKKPFLGICLGFQCAIIEGARHLLQLNEASSTEFTNDTPDPVVMFMPEGSKTHMGGTMRLGLRRTIFQRVGPKSEMSLSQKLHGGSDFVDERHRHRYEVNPKYVDRLEKVGYRFVGKDETGKRMEIFELDRKTHPFFVGCQYHPELKSRPSTPSPNFYGLILASSGQLDQFLKDFRVAPPPSQSETPVVDRSSRR